MARSYICTYIDRDVITPVPGIALDTLFLVAVQALAVIVLSKFIHLFLGRYNQPSAISQIFAGVVIGGLGLRNAIVHVDVDNVEDMYGAYISAARILYMFLVGLEMDHSALRNATRRCVAFTYATVAASLLVAAVVSGGMYGSMMHSPVKTPALLAATLMLALANTSSLAVARIAGELKLMVTESGRLIVATAIATNIICVIGEGVLSCTTLAKEKTQGRERGLHRVKGGFLALTVAAIALWLVRPVVTLVNRQNVGQHHVRNRDLALMLFAVWFLGNIEQLLGFDGMPTSFLLGLAFPREGPAARTVADALTPPVHGLLLPFYFATIGMRMNFNAMSGAIFVPGVFLTLLGLVGKLLGAAAASAYLNIPLSNALRFGVLLNVKGHVDTMNMNFAKSEGVWAEQALYAMIIGNLISTIIAGPVAAAVLHKERLAYASRHQAVESLGKNQELRMLAVTHSPHAAPGMLSLLELMVSAPHAQPAVHILHFFDAPRERATSKVPYHQKIRDTEGQDDGAVDAIAQMNTTVDVFSRATGIVFRQIDVADDGTAREAGVVCRCAEDVRAGLLLLPHHREQRYDGKMACRWEERRQLNLDVLAHAPCTIGVLVDRPYRSAGTSFQVPSSIATSTRAVMHPCSERAVTHVAAVFFGGPDDREAVSFACRLASHPTIGLTVFRFVQRSTFNPADRISSAAYDELSLAYREGDVDERFMLRFHQRYVERELAMYVEKVVGVPTDVVATLEGMAGMFSLVVVGRGGRQPGEIMVALDGWAEGAEIGPVGEILASNESLEMGSVLILQQHTVVLSPQRRRRDDNS